MTVFDDKLLARFWAKVDVRGPDECWPWTGMKAAKRGGYGVFQIRGKISPGLRKAHRLSYEIACGPPGELHVLHKCDNPPCVNPNHLWLGTIADNNKDMVRKGRLHKNKPPHPIGSAHPLSKLQESDIPEIRRLIEARWIDRLIAEKFGVTRLVIWKIRHGTGWKHVP